MTPAEGVRAERELFGAVLAIFAHEANNRLATLQESAGLLGDLLGAAKGGKGEAVRECVRTAAGLEEQLARLGEMNRRLARVADAVRVEGRADAAVLLEDLLALTERLARQRRVRVVRELAPDLPCVAADPAALLALAWRLVSRGLGRCPAEGTLRVSAARSGEGAVRIAVCGWPGSGEADATARGLAAALGGALEEGGSGGEIAVRLAVAG